MAKTSVQKIIIKTGYMCNCGSKRTEMASSGKQASAGSASGSQTRPGWYTVFEYTGETALTLFGRGTGLRYRFDHAGARANIDFRDVPGVEQIPVLRKVADEG